MRNGWIYVNLRNKTFRAERGAGRLGRRSGGVMRFFGGGMAEFVRKGRKIKKDAPISARDGTYMIFGESVLGKLAMTFLMAMVPVVELRGGPFRWGWPPDCRLPWPPSRRWREI